MAVRLSYTTHSLLNLGSAKPIQNSFSYKGGLIGLLICWLLLLAILRRKVASLSSLILVSLLVTPTFQIGTQLFDKARLTVRAVDLVFTRLCFVTIYHSTELALTPVTMETLSRQSIRRLLRCFLFLLSLLHSFRLRLFLL